MFKKTFKLFHGHYRLKYKGVYRHAKKLFFFDLGLLALALSMLGLSLFLFFWKPGITDLIDLNISLGTDRIKSGQNVHLTIDYLNRSEHILKDVVLSLDTPEGFVIDRSSVEKTDFADDSTFPSIKEIKPGAKGQLELYGWLWSEPNVEDKIIARLTYQPSETDRQEQKISHYLVRLSDSLLHGQLNIAQASFINNPLEFTYTITNHSTQVLDGITLAHNWTKDIFIEQFEKISLQPEQSKTIRGKLSTPTQTGNFDLQITPKILINNHPIPQKTDKQNIEAVAPSISSAVKFMDNTKYVEAGAVVPIQLSWKNQSGYRLDNMQMQVQANYSNMINWQKTATESHIKYDKDKLIIDNQARTKLSDGQAGSSDEFTINLYLNSYYNLPAQKNLYLQITPIMQAGLEKVAEQKYTETGHGAEIPIATQVGLNAQARYYTDDGDQIGRDYLPPRVGKSTKYYIIIQISNGTNPIKGAEFSAILPNGVELTGRDSVTIGKNINYDKAKRQISWQYKNELPANSTTGINFEVQVIPTENQIGQKLPLLKNINLSATDNFVNKKISLQNTAGIDNILPTQDLGSKKGYQVNY
ncbi:MAG: hypothetical protein ABIH87_04065 [bacterium]